MSIRTDLLKIAVFAIVAGLFGVMLAVTLSRSSLGGSEDGYYAVLSHASGLQEGDLVRVAGVEVGQVDGVSIGTHNKVLVEFHVASSRPLTDETRLLVRYENLLGDRYVDLAQQAGTGQMIQPGSTIPVSRTAPALDLDVLLNGFKPLFQGLEPAQVNNLANSIVQTLQGRAGMVQQLLERTGSLTGSLAQRDKVIGSLVNNLNVVLGRLDENDTELRGTIDQMQRLVSGLARDREPIGNAVAHIGRLTVSLTELLRNVRPHLRTDIMRARLVAAVVNQNGRELRSLLDDIPRALQILSRVGSHGAFFNFYLCGVDLRVTGPNGPLDLKGMSANSATDRCQPRGGGS